MCKLIEFLNENNGAIIVLLTAILAIINIFQWRLANRLRKEANQPKVMANVVGIYNEVHYKLVNYGTTSAIDVKVTIDENIITRKQQKDPQRIELEQLMNSSISILPNGVVYIPTKCSWLDINHSPIKLSYTYKDLAGNKYSEKYIFELSALDSIEEKSHWEQEDKKTKDEIKKALISIAEFCKK